MWHVEKNDTAEKVAQRMGAIDETNCIIDAKLEGTSFADGNYTVIVDARDIAGRKLDLQQSTASFQIARELPKVDIVSPKDNEFIATDFIPISRTFASAEQIREVRASFKGMDSRNQSSTGNTIVSLEEKSESWSISLGKDLLAGRYAIEIVVTDIYGNELQVPSRTVTIDLQAPQIKGALDGVPQLPYVQEDGNYHQRIIEKDGHRRVIIETAGAAHPLGWETTAIIHRWINR